MKKQKLYSQILENYLHFKAKRNAEKTEPIPVKMSDKSQTSSETISTVTPDNEKQSVGEIVEVLPKILYQKAKLILPRIQDNSKILNWNHRAN